MVKCLVIGIPESSRVTGFCQAATEAGWPAPEVSSWMDVLEGRHFKEWNGLVRLESPGRNWSTERALLLRGCDEVEADDRETLAKFHRIELERMSEPVGRILAMRQWYFGWKQALEEIERHFSAATFLTTPTDVALLFDKHACQEHLESRGCRMPKSLGLPVSAEDLMARMEQTHSNRIF